MPVRTNKVKIEFQDLSGKCIKIELSGPATGQEIKKIYDFLTNSVSTEYEMDEQKDTKFQRFYDILQKHFPTGEFTSSDLLLIAQEQFGTQIKHALVSTYLMRLVDRGLLNRKWSSAGWVYSLSKSPIIQR
ncbi:MAG: hypothetical protein QXJ17_03630 [Nitrososphaeria archaeon]